jgi:hypothetical protein
MKRKFEFQKLSFFVHTFLQIVAVILSNTGIALLAYMDGVAQTRTLGGVVLAAAAALEPAALRVRAGAAVAELLESLTAAPREPESGAPESAEATPTPLKTAAPTPSATANPPTRPT